MTPGEVIPAAGSITINAGRAVTSLLVRNTGDRPVQVGSHFHFAEVNPALDFDRAAARGQRLAVPAGTGVRFEPGIEREVDLVAFAGGRWAAGFRGEVAGPLDPPGDGRGGGPGTSVAVSNPNPRKGPLGGPGGGQRDQEGPGAGGG